MRKFEPWVGSLYREEGLSGIRVFILGESHYGIAGDEIPSLTRDVVKEWGQEKRYRFFTVTQKLVMGIAPGIWVSDADRKEFWERVVFYNFIQEFPGPTSRRRPTLEMWSTAKSPFIGTLQELDPQVLIVLGQDLQKNLPEIPSGIHVCFIKHPSSGGLRYSQWQPGIQSVLRKAKDQK